jgi:hypothetical protein
MWIVYDCTANEVVFASCMKEIAKEVAIKESKFAAVQLYYDEEWWDKQQEKWSK